MRFGQCQAQNDEIAGPARNDGWAWNDAFAGVAAAQVAPPPLRWRGIGARRTVTLRASRRVQASAWTCLEVPKRGIFQKRGITELRLTILPKFLQQSPQG